MNKEVVGRSKKLGDRLKYNTLNADNEDPYLESIGLHSLRLVVFSKRPSAFQRRMQKYSNF